MKNKSKKSPVKTPPALTPGYRANFQTLLKAAQDDHLVLLSAIDKKTNEPRALVCAMNKIGEEFQPVPLAILCWDNPYSMFHDPTI